MLKKYCIATEKNQRAFFMLFFVVCLSLILSGCGKTVKFKKPDIKDDFCGPVMFYKYCKCAFHKEFCEDVGLSQSTANTYVRNEFNRWVAWKVKKFGEDCVAAGGIYHPKYKCEYCEHPFIKKGNKCVGPEEGKNEDDEDEKEETAFKPDGPLNNDCTVNNDFDQEWKKYSDFDDRIPFQSRSWEVQNAFNVHERILELKVENFKLQRDMEIDRQIRLEAIEYKKALARNIKQNLIKATIRLAYSTYTTIESGISAGKSFSTFLTSTKTLARAGGLLSTVKSVVPKDSKIAFNSKTITGKVANVGVETAYQALEALGNPKDVAIKFMTETKKATVPSADITPEEINILRDQHITKKFVDFAIAESYKVNGKRRDQIVDNENMIKQLEAKAAAWEAKEKERIKAMLEAQCLEQKKQYEED